jgi:hypothetical protein
MTLKKRYLCMMKDTLSIIFLVNCSYDFQPYCVTCTSSYLTLRNPSHARWGAVQLTVTDIFLSIPDCTHSVEPHAFSKIMHPGQEELMKGQCLLTIITFNFRMGGWEVEVYNDL